MDLILNITDKLKNDLDISYNIMCENNPQSMPKSLETWLKMLLAEAASTVISQSIRMEAMKDAAQEESGPPTNITN